jgi:hypothetical protein
MDTNIYYCLPQAGGRIRSQGNKMRRLRRRTREGVEVWVDGWVEEWVEGWAEGGVRV